MDGRDKLNSVGAGTDWLDWGSKFNAITELSYIRLNIACININESYIKTTWACSYIDSTV